MIQIGCKMIICKELRSKLEEMEDLMMSLLSWYSEKGWEEMMVEDSPLFQFILSPFVSSDQKCLVFLVCEFPTRIPRASKMKPLLSFFLMKKIFQPISEIATQRKLFHLVSLSSIFFNLGIYLRTLQFFKEFSSILEQMICMVAGMRKILLKQKQNAQVDWEEQEKIVKQLFLVYIAVGSVKQIQAHKSECERLQTILEETKKLAFNGNVLGAKIKECALFSVGKISLALSIEKD